MTFLMAWLNEYLPGFQQVHLSAALGMVVHEAIRLYRAVWSPLALYPLRRPFFYTITVLFLAAIGVVLAYFAQATTVLQAIAIGFAVPTGIRTLGGHVPGHDTDDQFNRDAKGWARGNKLAFAGFARRFFWY